MTTGTPAAVDEPAGAAALALRVAQAQGAQAGSVARTSLHALIDVLTVDVRSGSTVLIDEDIYPIGRWAAAAAHHERGEVITYRHHDAWDARRRARRHGAPVFLTDGLCGGCLWPAPLEELMDAADELGGHVVVDDTLAAGILGRRTHGGPVLGVGGGGTAAWLDLPADRLVWVASLAKAYAAPLALVTANAAQITRIREHGPTRVHSSSPTQCDVAAMRRALTAPDLAARRRRLEQLVLRVCRRARRAGYNPIGIPFPLIALPLSRGRALALQAHLRSRGVRALVTRSSCARATALALSLRADHSDAEVTRLLDALSQGSRRGAA